jgi:hypothetical protein
MFGYELNKNNQLNKKMVLIEQDAGYISPEDERNKNFINEINKIATGKPAITEPLTLTVVLQKFGVENRNGRIYPEHILKRENEKYQQLIKENRALGESNHPETSIIDNDRISHNIIKTWWDGKTLMGEIEIIMSPGFISQGIISCEGDRIANYLRKGIKIGVSSRGVGTLKNIAGKNIVQDDFELICWDIVTQPSTPGSWIFNTREEAQPFVESEEKKKTIIINEKIKNFLKG